MICVGTYKGFIGLDNFFIKIDFFRRVYLFLDKKHRIHREKRKNAVHLQRE